MGIMRGGTVVASKIPTSSICPGNLALCICNFILYCMKYETKFAAFLESEGYSKPNFGFRD